MHKVHPAAPPIAATSKLVAARPLSRPGDRVEQEADALAAAALRKPISAAAPAAGAAAAPANALPPDQRADFEPRFGHDFSRVRVHHDATASAQAAEMGASAFTVGEDIHFAGGAYAPGSAAGRRLLAHELAHVVQARDGRAPAGAVLRQTAGPLPESYAIQVGAEAKDVKGCVVVSSYDVGSGTASESTEPCPRFVTPPCQAALLILADFYHHVQPDPPRGATAPFKLSLEFEKITDGKSGVETRKEQDPAPKYGVPGTSLRASFGSKFWFPLEGTGTLRTTAALEHSRGTLLCIHELPFTVTPCE